MLVTFGLKVSATCTCRRVVPVNGVAPSTACPDCNRRVSLSWKKVLKQGHRTTILEDAAAQWKVGRSEKGGGDGLRTQLERKAETRCRQCKRAFTSDELAAAVELRKPFVCPGCKAEVPLRKPPAILSQVCPPVRFLLYEQLVHLAPDVTDGTTVCTCAGCGAPLAVDGSSKTVECDYCERRNVLPDALMKRLRPIAAQEVFLLLVESAPG